MPMIATITGQGIHCSTAWIARIGRSSRKAILRVTGAMNSLTVLLKASIALATGGTQEAG